MPTDAAVNARDRDLARSLFGDRITFTDADTAVMLFHSYAWTRMEPREK